MKNSLIEFGLGWEGHAVALWELCEPKTVNLLTVGFAENALMMEFIDQDDQLWGVCVEWPDTPSQRDMLKYAYSLERQLRYSQSMQKSYSIQPHLDFQLERDGFRFDIVPMTADFEWIEEYYG